MIRTVLFLTLVLEASDLAAAELVAPEFAPEFIECASAAAMKALADIEAPRPLRGYTRAARTPPEAAVSRSEYAWFPSLGGFVSSGFVSGTLPIDRIKVKVDPGP